jgi:hypothetical protein
MDISLPQLAYNIEQSLRIHAFYPPNLRRTASFHFSGMRLFFVEIEQINASLLPLSNSMTIFGSVFKKTSYSRFTGNSLL